LNEYLAPLFTKAATEEHHFGTSEYILMLVAVVGYWNRIAYSNTSNRTSFLADEKITGFAKVFTINTMLMNL
jgi:NADH-quinone oxidoreductase subunit L